MEKSSCLVCVGDLCRYRCRLNTFEIVGVANDWRQNELRNSAFLEALRLLRRVQNFR